MQLVLNWFDGIITDIDENPGILSSDNVMNIYPNPFSEISSIHLNIVENSNVQVAIYNIHGELVQTLIDNEYKNAGEYDLTWNRENQDGNIVNTGVYFVVLNNGNHTETNKLIVIE